MAEAVHDNETSNGATNTDEAETENLSTKLINLPVLTDSLQTVSKKCQDIRETNSYVEYGMTVAESSLDKAMKAGKSVLDSSTLAPITNRAIGNIRYLDKEAGAMVDKIFGSKTEQETGNEELAKNGLVQGKDGTKERPDQTSLASKDESIVSYLGRKFLEVTSFLIRFPKYAIVSILQLLQSTPENNRKRKERGLVCEEIQELEPSPVKRKYGDRQTSSDDGSLIEMLHVREDYVSDEDPDYEPPEHESEEEESEHELTESEKEEIGQEVEYLQQALIEHGVQFDTDTSRKIGKSKMECETENKDQSGSQQAKKEVSTSAVNEKSLTPTEEKAAKESDQPKPGSKTNEKEPEKGKDIPLKEKSEKTKAGSAKEDKFSPGKGIDPTSKTRKSSRSPLLEKLLSPGRRKSQKAKAKSENENLEMATSSEKAKSGVSEKSENSEKTKSDSNVDAESNSSMSTVTGPFDALKTGGKKAK